MTWDTVTVSEKSLSEKAWMKPGTTCYCLQHHAVNKKGQWEDARIKNLILSFPPIFAPLKYLFTLAELPQAESLRRTFKWEMCENCQKHIHPQWAPSKSHPLPVIYASFSELFCYPARGVGTLAIAYVARIWNFRWDVREKLVIDELREACEGSRNGRPSFAEWRELPLERWRFVLSSNREILFFIL